MNHSLELVKKIKQALISGRIMVQDVPIDDLKKCVYLELQTKKMTYTETQFDAVTNSYNEFCNMVYDGEDDRTKVILFLTGLEMCLHTVSDSVLSLANRDYWTSIHANRLPDSEIEEIIDFVDEKKQIRLLPYDFVESYLERECPVYHDDDCDMDYVMHDGKRMYFPRRMDAKGIADYYNVILAEQDARSPHCYGKDGYSIKEGDILVDAGGAEGFFTLDNIELISKAYVFDADKEWIEALEKTFEPFGERVEIRYGYVGDISDDDNNITLDNELDGIEVNYIKMDIEGYEKGALKGAQRIINGSQNLRCAICSYHCKEDEAWITDFFKRNGMETAHSHGYMCPDWINDGLLKAELRRGVVFGRKIN